MARKFHHIKLKEAGCAYILSADMQDSRRVGGVEIVNPFAPESVAIRVKLLW